jgi:hypothetical protein
MEHGLLRGYFKIESRDDPQKIREKVTGKVLTLAPALGPVVPALLALLDVPPERRPGTPSIRSSGASRRSMRWRSPAG